MAWFWRVVVLLLAIAITGTTAMKPTRKYQAAMEAALAAETTLLTCRAQRSRDPLDDAGCFETALAQNPYNATWWKQLGSLRLGASQLVKAARCFNQSASTVLEAQGFIGPLSKTSGLSDVGMLRLYKAREHDGAYELAKAWFTSHVLAHRLLSADRLMKRFMDELYPDDRTVLYRQLGSLGEIAAVKTAGAKPESTCRTCIVLEELPFAVGTWMTRMLSSAVLHVTTDARTEMRGFMREKCGGSLPYASSYRVDELLAFVSRCAIKDADMRQTVARDGAGLKKPYLKLDRTALHTAASLGLDYVVRHILERFPVLASARDNFGRTPLHYAASHRFASTFALIASMGGDTLARDGGGVTPLSLACNSMRTEVAKVAPEGACAGQQPPFESITDDDVDDDDVDGSGGGWGSAARAVESRCAIDVRALSGLSHDTVVGEFLLSSRPVVLRGMPARVQKLTQRSRLLKDFAAVKMRNESVPSAESFGRIVYSDNATLRDAVSEMEPGLFFVAETPKRHPLHRTVRFVPPVLNPKMGYTTAADDAPLTIIAGRRAVTNHAIASSHIAFLVPHGRVEFVVRPPPDATATSYDALFNSSTPHEVRCAIQGGETLVLPQFWSHAFRMLSDGIIIKRSVYWR